MIEYGLLCAKRLAEVLLKLSNTKNTLEFEIPDGYELDKDNSTGCKLVYKKKDEYEPKEGDLVVMDTCDVREYITLFTEHKKDKYPVVRYDVLDFVPKGEICSYPVFTTGKIHPATNFHMDLYAKTLAENGYEFDDENKVVRKKRWRAEKGGQYFYVSTSLIVCVSSDLYCLQGNVHYSIGNYFRTREEAEEVAAEFRKILNNKKA